ncbi:hypothetical protein RIF29_27518 [Crotalaria pallida]|uniref:Uncharacterized protein n=1 Tax=Crotalaria pallida TaxID=3830 RepID=A0AAN9EWF4_CROPI
MQRMEKEEEEEDVKEEGEEEEDAEEKVEEEKDKFDSEMPLALLLVDEESPTIHDKVVVISTNLKWLLDLMNLGPDFIHCFVPNWRRDRECALLLLMMRNNDVLLVPALAPLFVDVDVAAFVANSWLKLHLQLLGNVVISNSFAFCLRINHHCLLQDKAMLAYWHQRENDGQDDERGRGIVIRWQLSPLTFAMDSETIVVIGW